MLRYKNTSVTAKTFYGTTFKPGEEKDVPGYINDPKMVRVSVKPEELPKAASKKAPAPVVVEEKPTQTKSAESKQNKESNKEEN